jgi:hypothetical protein
MQELDKQRTEGIVESNALLVEEDTLDGYDEGLEEEAYIAQVETIPGRFC